MEKLSAELENTGEEIINAKIKTIALQGISMAKCWTI